MPGRDVKVPVETVGERLRRLRLDQGLSQRHLEVPGVSYAYISRIEGGQRTPSVKAIRRLAARLRVHPDYLERGVEPAVFEGVAGDGDTLEAFLDVLSEDLSAWVRVTVEVIS